MTPFAGENLPQEFRPILHDEDLHYVEQLSEELQSRFAWKIFQILASGAAETAVGLYHVFAPRPMAPVEIAAVMTAHMISIVGFGRGIREAISTNSRLRTVEAAISAYKEK